LTRRSRPTRTSWSASNEPWNAKSRHYARPSQDFCRDRFYKTPFGPKKIPAIIFPPEKTNNYNLFEYYGRKSFRVNFCPQILDKFPP
jgi:hypothetical protein